MSKYLDLDDAVANVTGDVAKRELNELRRQRDELAEALRELVEAGEDVWDFNRPCLQEGRNALANLDSEPEQPAVPEPMTLEEAKMKVSRSAQVFAVGWNQCREAMLNLRENRGRE